MIKKENFLEEVSGGNALKANTRLQTLKLRAKLFLIENAGMAYTGNEIVEGVKQYYKTQRKEEILLRMRKEEFAKIEDEEKDRKKAKAEGAGTVPDNEVVREYEKPGRVKEAVEKRMDEINEEVEAKVRKDVPFHDSELPYPVIRYLRKKDSSQYGTVQYADMRLINEGDVLRQYFMWVEESIAEEKEETSEPHML